MTFAAQALADGFVATSSGAVFTGTATATYIKRLSLYNTNAAEQTIVLYVNYSGTDREWKRFVLAQHETAEAVEEGRSVILEAGDIIKAVTTTSSAVTYSIDGVEET